MFLTDKEHYSELNVFKFRILQNVLRIHRKIIFRYLVRTK